MFKKDKKVRLIDVNTLPTMTFKGVGGDGSTVEFIFVRKDDIDKAPTFDPYSHGRWLVQNAGRTRFSCSVCGSENWGGYEKFCPSCGAMMDGD